MVFFDTRSLLYHLPRPRRWFWDTLGANNPFMAGRCWPPC
jgi:hypothetical protein